MTPDSSTSSNASRALRIELRRSRWQAGVLALLTAAQPVAWWLSEAERVLAVGLSVAGMGYGVHCLRVVLDRRPRTLALGAGGAAWLDGRALPFVSIEPRGPFLVLRWRRGRRGAALAIWPDMLAPGMARELRLWARTHRDDGQAAAVAP